MLEAAALAHEQEAHDWRRPQRDNAKVYEHIEDADNSQNTSHPIPTLSPTPFVIVTSSNNYTSSLPRHVVFSSSRPPQSHEQRIICDNSIWSVMQLQRVTYIFFSDLARKNDVGANVTRNVFTYPVLTSLFEHAISLVPNHDSYTWFNNDLIFNHSFVDTLDRIVLDARAGRISTRFFAIGRRTNVDWPHSFRLMDNPSTWNFTSTLHKGVAFWDHAQDFFICSPNLWRWPSSDGILLPLVVGRRGIDNWFAQIAIRNRLVSSIDVSKTSPVIHQTRSEVGNYAGHEGILDDNVDYNLRLLATRYEGLWDRIWSPSGKMSHCAYETTWGTDGNIQIVARPRNRTHYNLPPSSAPTHVQSYKQQLHYELLKIKHKQDFITRTMARTNSITTIAKLLCEHTNLEVKEYGLATLQNATTIRDWAWTYERAQCLLEVKNYPLALFGFRDAEHSATTPTDQARSLRGMAKALLKMGQLSDAMGVFEQVLRIRLDISSTPNLQLAESFDDLAEISLELGHWKEAAKLGARAIQEMTTVYGSRHEKTIQLIEEWGD